MSNVQHKQAFIIWSWCLSIFLSNWDILPIFNLLLLFFLLEIGSSAESLPDGFTTKGSQSAYSKNEQSIWVRWCGSWHIKADNYWWTGIWIADFTVSLETCLKQSLCEIVKQCQSHIDSAYLFQVYHPDSKTLLPDKQKLIWSFSLQYTNTMIKENKLQQQQISPTAIVRCIKL